MTIPRLFPLFIAASCLSVVAARAQDPNVYVDDRSDGPAIVRSLYNAIARKEFARAYSYFGDQKPATDYSTFVAGYDNTVDVKVLTGTVTSEGAAGSVYMPVPVAIQATDKGGKQHVFAGCYLTRIVSAAIQEPPFTPLHIESAELEESDLAFPDAVPKVCHSPS